MHVLLRGHPRTIGSQPISRYLANPQMPPATHIDLLGSTQQLLATTAQLQEYCQLVLGAPNTAAEGMLTRTTDSAV